MGCSNSKSVEVQQEAKAPFQKVLLDAEERVQRRKDRVARREKRRGRSSKLALHDNDAPLELVSNEIENEPSADEPNPPPPSINTNTEKFVESEDETFQKVHEDRQVQEFKVEHDSPREEVGVDYSNKDDLDVECPRSASRDEMAVNPLAAAPEEPPVLNQTHDFATSRNNILTRSMVLATSFGQETQSRGSVSNVSPRNNSISPPLTTQVGNSSGPVWRTLSELLPPGSSTTAAPTSSTNETLLNSLDRE